MKHFSTAIKKRGWLRIGAALLIIAGLLAAVLPASQAPAVASNQFQDEPVELCGGQCAHKTITFETGDLRIDKVDVVFLIDASGSMDDEIDEVQNQSLEIMDMLRELVSDSAFGAASFVDYNGFVDSQYGETYGSEDDYPYRLGQDITEDTGDLQDALNGIALEYGNDSPESYSRALWEMQFLNWREDSKRIVILFGDAYPHDRTFFGEDFGVDPGPDETEGTEDDLVFAEVVQDLIDARISVVGVNSGYDSDNAVAFFQHVAEQTGGLYFPLYNADEIPDAVAQSVEEEISTIDRLTVRATRGYEDWIASAPEAYTDVGSHETNSFEVDICPAAGRAEAGTHEFELIIDGDGTVLESIPVVVDYTRRCTTGPQVYIADSDDDDGSVCSEGPFWQSPDLINRTDDDGIHHHQNPVRGQTNYLYARVHNIGDRDAREVRISLYWANPAIGLWYPDHWNRIGSTTVDVVDVGQEIWTEGIPWNPPGAPGEDHLCALARIESDEDPILREGDVPCDNNIAQRNLHVLDLDPDQPETSDKMSFRVIAPPDEHMGVIDIVVII
ncbi:MAG: vWA domain-containing protein, partial [Anaerolineae bacterium]